MAKKDYHSWDKQSLIDEITSLKKRKKYGIVWENKPEDVVEQCKENLPVLEEVKGLAIRTDSDQATDLLIEGDNYHALSVLNYTHKKKIDVIYIDPPYNTGAKDWKYNNNFVDETDGYRHSKWLSMMSNRLAIAKKLLSPRGFLICAIDEYEVHNIRHLLDDIFGEKNKLGMVTVLHNPKGRNLSTFFSSNSEFMLVYAKNHKEATFNSVVIDEEIMASFDHTDESGKFRWEPFMRVRVDSSQSNKPRNYYPIYVDKHLKNFSLSPKKNYHKIYPETQDGRKWAWKLIAESFNNLNKDGYFRAEKENDRIVIKHKYREKQVFKNVWTNKKYQSEFNGTNLLKGMLGANIFNYPKSLYLLLDILKITTNKKSVVLDFFAGSGTTGHAVSLLNKEDGGNRRFILCTNNENEIARKVCHPRIKAVIKGHPNYPDITGIPSNLKYFKTVFVAGAATNPTDRNKIALTLKAAQMLCIKEGTYELVKETAAYKIFRNQNRYTGIIYKATAINAFKKAISKIDGQFSVYIFSFADEDFSEEFADTKQKTKLQPIPEVILRTYRQIFK